MKIKGAKNSKQTKTVNFMGGSVTIKPISLLFAIETEEQLPEPTPPILNYARDKGGKIIRENGVAVPVYDYSSPEYKRALSMQRNLVSVKMVVDSVADGLEFDTPADLLKENPRKYYEEIFKELNEYGCSVGDLTQLANEISRLSNIDDKLEGMQENFTRS